MGLAPGTFGRLFLQQVGNAHGLGRIPDRFERERLASYFEEQKELLATDSASISLLAPNDLPGVERIETAAWTAVGRALMNLDAFITRE